MPEEHKSIAAYLRSSQIAVEKQVLIEAKILEVSLRDGFETGINWAAFFSRQGETLGIGMLTPGTTLGTSGTNQILQGGLPSTGIQTPLTAGIPATGASLANAGRALAASVDALGTIFGVAVQTKNFAALMTFLDSQGVVHTLSSPRIATMNNQKAVLKVGADQLFVTKITGGSVTPASLGVAATFSSPTFDVQSFFSGIALDVTPRIADDGSIVLHVRPSVSTVNQNLSTFNLGALGTYQIPLVSNAISETDSVIRAQDGQIVAIGGLMRQAQTEQRNQVPGLGNLPFAGAAFRNVSQASEKRELVILLKPTVIHGDDSWGRTIGEPRQRIQTMDRGFSWGSHSDVFGTGAENYTPPR
jgi:MSHA biogenesis protein MshL